MPGVNFRQAAIACLAAVMFACVSSSPKLDPPPRDGTLRDIPPKLHLTVMDAGTAHTFAVTDGSLVQAPPAECVSETMAASPEAELSALGIDRPRTESVTSIAWSPDAAYLAILSVRERMGKSPLALLAALSGHPIQHQTYRIHVYGRDGRHVGSTQDLRGFIGTSGRLCWNQP
jgi:hypothetical protein